MIRTGELRIQAPITREGRIRAAATLRTSQGEGKLWFSLDESQAAVLTDRADPFLLAALWPMMRRGGRLSVRGAPVSAGLVDNLLRFQRVWRIWRGGSLVTIDAEIAEGAQTPAATVAAFSGGVDSSFTIWRHAHGGAQPPVGQVAMVHGFDIPLADTMGFAGARALARRLVDTLGVGLIDMSTNIRSVNRDWEDAHGLCVAAALTLLSGSFGAGLIAGSSSRFAPVVPWGSNHLTDPLLGSSNFAILHDGDAERTEKLSELLEWPEARRLLRVCYSGPRYDRNCGC
ncbi:MAG: hypothetical protein ABR564_02170, partial [Candidatus Dormibacteria bacterium]